MARLETTVAAAARARVGPDGSPAFGAMLEALRRAVAQLADDADHKPRKTARESQSRPTRRPAKQEDPSRRSAGTVARAVSALDLARLESFVIHRWEPAIRALRGAELPGPQRAKELDQLGALPILASLLAATHGWISSVEGVRLAARAATIALDSRGRSPGPLGRLTQPAAPIEVREVFATGLLQHALAGWVRHLERETGDDLTIRRALLRTWANHLRSVVDETDARAMTVPDGWRELLGEDSMLPAPSEEEERLAELEEWLSKTPGSRLATMPKDDAVLWHPRMGWSRAQASGQSRTARELGIYVIARDQVVRLKLKNAVGWVNIAKLAEGHAGMPEELRPAVEMATRAVRW